MTRCPLTRSLLAALFVYSLCAPIMLFTSADAAGNKDDSGKSAQVSKPHKKLPEAQQKAFEKGVTPEETKKLQTTIKKMSDEMKQIGQMAKQIRSSKVVQDNPRLKAAAGKFLKQYSRTGTVLDGLREALAARDANLKSYEVKLKTELAALDKEIDALNAAVGKEQATELASTIAAGILLADALSSDYVIFDTAYVTVVTDIPVEIEVYDIYTEINVIEETEVWSEEAWVEYEEEYIAVEENDWNIDVDGGYDTMEEVAVEEDDTGEANDTGDTVDESDATDADDESASSDTDASDAENAGDTGDAGDAGGEEE